jgi:hypothetical protein
LAIAILVTRWKKRSKKILKLAVFGVQLRAILIDPLAAESTEILRRIPKILRYSFTVIVLLINQKDYEHFINVGGFKMKGLRILWFRSGDFSVG